MHKIETHILHQLVRHASLRYSDIKPAGTEGNHFMYYLKKLLREKLVAKSSDGSYSLSSLGKRHADTLSLTNLQPRIQPKIVTLLVITNSKGELLLYHRKRQPFFGLTGFPYGKIHLGETVKEAAIRELKEKTGLSAKLSHVGDAYISAYEKDELISQMLAHIFVGKDPSGTLQTDSSISRYFWGKLTDTPKSQVLPANLDILKLIKKSSSHFFAEFTTRA